MNPLNLNYKLVFHTDWHSGSGQSRGADVDALVVKDVDGLPFIPGKVMKGLLREAMEELMFLNGKDADDEYRQAMIDFFGNSTDRNMIQQVVEKDYECMVRGSGFFTNAVLQDSVTVEILKNHAERFLYRGISRTKIDTNGLAVNQSLRRMEVVVPCVLYGEIHQIPEILKADLASSLGYIKRMGLGRNRGLGRCSIEVIEEGERE